MPMRRAAGFTLIELMVTIGIAAILLALALPTFTESIRSNRVSTATNQMLATINFARAEALRSKSTAHVCPSNVGGTDCSTAWAQGMLVWTDENGDGDFDTPAEIKRVIEPQTGIELSMPAGVTDIGFNERGRTATNLAYAFTLQAEECIGAAENRRDFSINRIGRVTVTREKCQ